MTAALIGTLAAGLVERIDPDRRGRDRQVRRGSIDENDAAAQPWADNRFATPALRFATTEALIDLAKEEQRGACERFTRPYVQELRQRAAELRATIRQMSEPGAGAAPIGHLAAMRIELAKVDAELAEWDASLTRIDVDVLRAILSFLRRTGELIADWASIAAAAGCKRGSVGRALARLEARGYFARVRRSRRVAENEGRFGQQREQIANAIRLTIGSLSARLRARFLQLREKRHRRMTKGKAPMPSPAWQAAVTNPALRQVLTGLAASIENASP